MKASIIVASTLTAILVLPQLVFGTLTGAEAIVATIHSFCAAFLVMIFAPQLAQFVPHGVPSGGGNDPLDRLMR